MSSISHAERIALANDVYGIKNPADQTQIPKGYSLLKFKELDHSCPK
ncbi:hypothetical protein [Desulfofustis limnaeus]|uniref:Uncharacterized protein n=1 Tax=Desulfofustis limnaeus TaxID=2740163 RepID=A0ABM7W9Z8_9BACT|nr:hypothetical protein [Desulfofustis limnaeus]BDD87693.1 hypothetical protein DPPLL_20580 [Desulfofustis limnaeus]